MFRPAVESFLGRARRGQTRLTSATLALAVLTPGALSGALAPAPAVDLVSVSAGAGDVPILGVDLLHGGTVVNQTASATGVVDHGHDPVEITGVTVDDGGARLLVPRPGAIEISRLGYPAGLTGVSVSENGAQTPVATAPFEAALERAGASLDLRDYARSDQLSEPGSGWGADYDLTFAAPLAGDDQLLVQERNGNSRATLIALDATGEPTGQPVEVGPTYGWDTGYAPADRTPAQTFHLTVVPIDAFAVGGPISGFRVDNDDEADLKLIPMAPVAAGGAIATSLATAADGPVAIGKYVYPGHDGGASCAGAKTFTEAGQNDPVTYCFTVTNTGVDALADLVVHDPLAGGTPILVEAESTPLAPGHTARYYVESTPPPDDADGFVDDTFINTAAVTATPVDGAGTPTAPVGSATASAEAVVFPSESVEAPQAQISLVASVYAGVDGGVGCPAAKSTLVDDGGAVTYCYTVTNTGNTHLDAIGLVDPIVTGTPTLLQAESQPLAPGASAHYYLDAVAPPAALVGFVTASVVTANPVDDTAADLVGLADVTSTDGARVDAVAAAAPEGPSPAAQAPAPAPAAPAVPQQPEPSPEGAPTASATAEAPTELAFTGWESWLIGAMGIGLIAGGWLLINREDQPLYATAGRTGRRSNPTATNPRSRSSRAD